MNGSKDNTAKTDDLISMIALCPEGTCSNHGICDPSNGNCTCDYGFYGTACDISYSDISK